MAAKDKNGTLLLLCFAALSWGYLAYGLAPPIVCCFYGKETVATFTKYLPRQDNEGHRIHDHEFKYDGHVAVRRFSKHYAIGHQRPMLYLPSRPTWVVSGSRQDSVWTVIDRNTNDIGLTITCVAAILTTMAVYGMMKKTARRRKEDSLRKAKSD